MRLMNSHTTAIRNRTHCIYSIFYSSFLIINHHCHKLKVILQQSHLIYFMARGSSLKIVYFVASFKIVRKIVSTYFRPVNTILPSYMQLRQHDPWVS